MYRKHANCIVEGGHFFERTRMLFYFMECPVGKLSSLYHGILIFSNIMYMIFITIETVGMKRKSLQTLSTQFINGHIWYLVDGPNYYQGRNNEALYYQLPTGKDYLVIKLVFSVPLMIHCIVRLMLAIVLHIASWAHKNDRMATNFFSRISNYLLFIWFIPLLVDTFHPGLWPYQSMGWYHLIDFLRHTKIIQSYQNVPAFIVTKETFRRMMRLVPIPVLIFFCINFVFGQIFYIIDPCFNEQTCPFPTLFTAVFYCIVSMTTSKVHIG